MADEKRLTIREALAKLAELGSVRKVADHLSGHGVKGRKSRTSECPLAVYLARVTGLAVTVDDEGARTGKTAYELPGVLIEFVGRFDDGYLPELDAEAVTDA